MQLTLAKVNGPPLPGEWWCLSVDDFDPNNRSQEEEYYAEVLSYEMVPSLSFDSHMVFTVQDLGEESGPEPVTLSRSSFVYVSS